VKRLPILTRMLLLLVCFSFMLFAANSGSTLNGVLVIPYVADAPDIDGVMDEEWIFQPNGLFCYEQFESEDEVPASEDHAAYFKAAYNEDGFYLWAKVLDDIVTGEGSTNSYENDCFEIYFDGDNSDSATYDGIDDVQWRYVYGYTENEAGWCDLYAGGECAWVEEEDGYTFELSLDAADLADTNIVFEPGDVIGFEVQCADNDNEEEAAAGTRENIVKWWNLDGTSWQHPTLFGQALLGEDGDLEDEVIGDFVLEMEEGADIDAENTDDEWTAIPEVKLSVNESWTMGDDEGFKDFQPYYKAGYNDDGFYFFGLVLDDVVTGEGSTNSYENDCFEIYFDGDNSDSATYDGIDDVQWRYVYGYTENEAGWCDLYSAGECAWAELAGGNGYTFELFLDAGDLADTNIVLEDGAEIGFEVQCADNDNTGEATAGTRDVISKWWNIDGTSWQHPNLFGTVLLGTSSTAPDPNPIAGVEEEAAAGISVDVPAIVSSSVLAISSAADIANAVLYNIAGQEVAAAAGNGGNAVLDVANLPNGVYLCKVEAGNGSVTKKVTLLK
jgi:hypothetical protein